MAVSLDFCPVKLAMSSFHKSVVPSSETIVGPFPEMQIPFTVFIFSPNSLAAAAKAGNHCNEILFFFVNVKFCCENAKIVPSDEINAAFKEEVPISAQKIEVSVRTLLELSFKALSLQFFRQLQSARSLELFKKLFNDVAVVK